MSTKSAQSNSKPAVKRRRSSIRLKIAFWAGLWLALGSLILSAYTAYNTRQSNIKNATNEAISIAELQSGQVIGVLDPPLMTARALATALTSLKDPSIPIGLSRDDVNAMLRKTLIENPSFHGVYTLWEPNEFDELDLTYENAVAHDNTGRFIPYWVRGDEGIIHTEALTQYETPGTGDWYILPRSTKQEVVLAPLFTTIQGQDVVMASFIAPIVEHDKFYGVVGVDAPITVIQNMVDGVDYYEGTAEAALFTDNGTLIAVRHRPELVNQSVEQIYPDYEQFKSSLTKNISRISLDGKSLQIFVPLVVDAQGTRWVVSLNIPVEKITVPATNAAIRQFIVSLAYILLALVFLWLATGQIVRPLQTLTDAATSISQGDLAVTANVHSNDETAVLADAFNAMTSQLKGVFSSLEQRVATRTHDLATVAEVSTAAASILETRKLLQDVVDLTKERFNLYHSHIYLLDENGRDLVLAAGAGEPGRVMVAQGHSIPLEREQSLVARAARERKGVTVNDVTQAPDFLPNPLLPDTRSELAAPMIAGENLIGVFDIQSDIAGRFTEADISVQTALASQVAVALQNVRQFEQSQRSEARFRAVTETASDAIISADEHGNIIYLNPTARNIFGLLEEEAIGQSLKIIMPEQFHHQHDSGMNRYLHTKVPHVIGQTVQLIGKRRNGEEFPIELSLASWEAGENTFFTALIRDITERKKSEETLAQHARQQETLNLITQKIQSAATVESAMQIAARELGHALGQKPTLVALDPMGRSDKRKTERQTS